MNIIAAIIGGLFVIIGVFVAHKLNSLRDRDNRRIQSAKTLIQSFEPITKNIREYKGYFNQLMRLMHQEFPNQQKSIIDFRKHLSNKQRKAFDIVWKQYHGNDEQHPNFIQYENRNPNGLLMSRIKEILKFTE